MIIEVTTTADQIKQAYLDFQNYKSNNKTILGGNGVVEAYLAEIVVADQLRMARAVASRDYDLLQGIKTFDVKNKRCASIPKKEYVCGMPSYQKAMKQNCDYYIFTRVNVDLKTVWLLGYIEPKGFRKKAKFLKAGHITKNGLTAKYDEYILKIKSLKKILDLYAPMDVPNLKVLNG